MKMTERCTGANCQRMFCVPEFVASTHGTLSISTNLGDILVLRPHTLVIVSSEPVVENLEKRNEEILKLQAVLLLIGVLVSLNHCFILQGH